MNVHGHTELQGKPFTAFLLETTFDDLPQTVVKWTKRCLLDLICVAAAGRQTTLSAIIYEHVVEHFGAGRHSAHLLFDGRKVSPVGAALAAGMTIDAVDAHDGQKLTKGHVGCGLLPSVLAMAEAQDLEDGEEFLHRLALGYEIGSRAGIALHTSVDDYHTSGAWIAIACAALGARALNLSQEQMRHALGIAEYHGPRSQMMRVIEHPVMLKDGSGYGAMAGTSAAYLAKAGFTGAPAITVEAEEVSKFWSDLGTHWRIFEQYVKLWPVCRWAQPAAEAVMALAATHNIASQDIDHVEVTTFHEAKCLDTRLPENTEQAQYSLPWPVAAALSKGKITVAEVTEDAFGDTETRRLSNCMIIRESDEYNAAFPARRIAHAELHMKNGAVHKSRPTEARGDPEAPFSDEEMRSKFYTYCEPVTGKDRAAAIEDAVFNLENKNGFKTLQTLLTAPV